MRRLFLLLVLCLLGMASPAHAALGPDALPSGWPSTLGIGLRSGEAEAAPLRASAPSLAFRYQYLSGDATLTNAKQHWSTYAQGNGTFVSDYVADSVANGFIPVFSLYSMLESSPGFGNPDESAVAHTNLLSPVTVASWLNQLELFYTRAAGTTPVVLQVEPDLWGYAQKAISTDDAANVPVALGGSGRIDTIGEPDNLRGFAQTIVRMRDRLAPNVVLAYPVSIWGTGRDISVSDDADDVVDQLAARTSKFYASLGASFDMLFWEVSNADSAYKEKVLGDAQAWWNAADFAREARFIRDVTAATHRRGVLWQVPLGNTVMRAENNTAGHYQDNRVQTLLVDPAKTALRAYIDAGIAGILFGDALPQATCACDRGDGITNPDPITGNVRMSLSADDDGGYFKEAAARYAAHPLSLPGSVSKPAPAVTLSVRARVLKSGLKARKAGYVRVRLTSKRTLRARVALQIARKGTFTEVSNLSTSLVQGRPRTLSLFWKPTTRGSFRAQISLKPSGKPDAVPLATVSAGRVVVGG